MHPIIALIRRGRGIQIPQPLSRPLSHPIVTLARRSALRSSASRNALQSPFALRSEADLRKYQRHTVDLISQTLEPNGPPGVIMALEPGAGKTVSTLTAIRKLLDAGKIKKVLIVAPLLVARTVWHSEITQWLHTQGTSYSIIVGDAKTRATKAAERTEVHIINKETVPWLWEHFAKGAKWPYDFLVIDEASMLKNGKKRTAKHKLTRFGTLAQARKHFKSVVELTGTPAPNGLVNLWGLAYIVDQGERLGRTRQAFLDRWFDQNQYTYEITPKPGAEKEIMDRIKDIMFSLDPKDYVDLPPLVENNIKVQLPPKIMAEYRRFKRTLISEMYDVEAVNAAVLTNKLLQAANGSWIDNDGVVKHLHDCKLDALENLHDEVNGAPMLVAYSYIFDKERIKTRFPKAVILNEVDDVMKTVDRWNAGGIDMLLAHPACLHPDTEVLTEYRGWVKIVEVEPWDRVFDGVEFVSHKGCHYSGFKEVIEVFGITMTLDHRLLVGGKWVRARDVGTDTNTREAARYSNSLNATGARSLSELRSRVRNAGTELPEAQPTWKQVLRQMHQGYVSLHDRYPHSWSMVWDALQNSRLVGHELRRSRYSCFGVLAQIRELLSGHGADIQERSHARTIGCEQGLLERELCLGSKFGAASQQTKQSSSGIQGRADASRGLVSLYGRQQNSTYLSFGKGYDARRSGGRCAEMHLRHREDSHWCQNEKDTSPSGKTCCARSHVYDLVDCGPRSRFLIRNADGEVFISHNSCGHGLNLQKGSNISCWYGLTADLELWQQFNKRLWRSGQTADRVWQHRIIAEGTHDEEILPILDRKDAVQSMVLRATMIDLSKSEA